MTETEAIWPVIRWHLTNDERLLIANGQDVYLFYHANSGHYSLEIAPEGTATGKTVSLLVEEPAPSGIYVRDRNDD